MAIHSFIGRLAGIFSFLFLNFFINNFGLAQNLPDLQLNNLTLQNTAEPGQVLNFLIDVSNTGSVPAAGNFSIKAWFSKDDRLSSDDIQDGIVQTGNFGPNQVIREVRAAARVPRDLAGSYFLILKIDADNTVNESNEDNNIVSKALGNIGQALTSSCSFQTVFTPSGFQPNFYGDPGLGDDTTGYHVFFDPPSSKSSTAPAVTEEYYLSLLGKVLQAGLSPKVYDYDVSLETDNDKNLTMVFNKSPHLPRGTRVAIDYDYENPDGVIAKTVYKTSTGYAFGIGLVTDGGSGLKNRIIQTDQFGKNVRVTELPNPAFYGGFYHLSEGIDGMLYTEWRTSGNYSMYIVSNDGQTVHHVSVAGDTPSTDWVDMRPGPDGKFVYVSLSDNQRAKVTKYDSKTGIASNIDLETFIQPASGSDIRKSRMKGVMPTEDGGFLVSVEWFAMTTSDSGDILGKFDADGKSVWRIEMNDNNYSVAPIGETFDGGALFVGLETQQGRKSKAVFIKTTATGELTPKCHKRTTLSNAKRF